MAEQNNNEIMLEKILNGDTSQIEQLSRIEKILLNCIQGLGDEGLEPPNSRAEAYLIALSLKLKK